jgi:predicted transposase YbfD/YdcC
MNIEAEKLELVQMLLDIKSSEVLQKVKATLAANSSAQPKKRIYADDTEYLLSTEANRKHLMESIAQLDRGQKTTIKTADL